MTVDRRAALVALGAAGAGVSAGCAWMPRPVVVPMPMLVEPGPCTDGAPTLVVLLPGAYSRPEEFIDEGFVAALRASGAAADAVIPDAHPGYFRDRSIFDRLRADVVGPARGRGQRVWLVGISLGGFGALAYALRHRADIDGIVVLAPYVGERSLLREIAAAGGPAAWHAQATASAPDRNDAARALWRGWTAPGADLPPLYLGYGREDRLVEGHRLLARTLPPDRVTEVPGGHDWPPWRALWQQWLSRGLLPRNCGPLAGVSRSRHLLHVHAAPAGR